jgi:Zn-dependent alcohol dehydrogenase
MTAAAIGAGQVVVADPAEHRRDEALSLGATHAIEGGDRREVRAQLVEAIGAPTVDVAVDAVGLPALVETGYSVIRQGGAVVAVGLQPPDAKITLTAPVVPLSHKRVLGCFMGGIDPQRDLPKLFALYQAGRLPIDRLVSAHRPLTETSEALDDLANARGLRTLIDLGA